MLATCPALGSGGAFLGSLLRHIDCQGRTLGLAGYETLAAPTSPVQIALTSALVIFVALFGLRLALGESTTLRDAVVAVVKIGIVLTLATSWPAFQVVVYDVVVDGPAQLGAAIGPTPDTAAAPGLINRLEGADRAIIRLTNLGTGREQYSVLPQAAGAPGEAAQRFPIADDPAFGWARVLFLSGTVAAFAAVRLTAGLLLALAPVFSALLLFRVGGGLFSAWVRALAFTFLASIGVAVVLGVELALLEPWLNETIRLRRAQALAPSAPVELLVLCLGFTAALIGTLGILLRATLVGHVSFGSLFRRADDGAVAVTSAPPTAAPSAPPGHFPTYRAPSRALAVADAVAAAQRRERSGAFSPGARQGAGRGQMAPPRATARADDLVIPDFGSTARRTRPRVSLGARLRDRRS